LASGSGGISSKHTSISSWRRGEEGRGSIQDRFSRGEQSTGVRGCSETRVKEGIIYLRTMFWVEPDRGKKVRKKGWNWALGLWPLRWGIWEGYCAGVKSPERKIQKMNRHQQGVGVTTLKSREEGANIWETADERRLAAQRDWYGRLTLIRTASS